MTKRCFWLILLILIWLFGWVRIPSFATLRCNGSGPFESTSVTCTWNPLTSQCITISTTQSGTSVCAFWAECNGGCCHLSRCISKCSDTCTQLACGAEYTFATSGCWTCDDAVCINSTISCSQNCGSTTESCTCSTLCDNVLSWTNTVACKECVVCSPRCGQALDCGGNCSNADNGAPAAPAIVSPIGTLANPVVVSPGTTATLVWNSVPALTDYYEAQVLDAGNSVAWTGTTTSTSIRTGSLIMGSAYSWRVRAVNTTCGTDIGGWSSRGYFRLNSIPSVSIVVLKNSSGTVVSWDAGNRNQICKPVFYSDPLPRRVRFEARVTDDDGADQIQTVQMRWNGNIYNLSLGTSAGVGLTASVTVDFSSGNNSASTYPLAFLAEDVYSSSGWVDSIYSWKVWDCLVPVSGKLYDGSAGQACNNTGFTVTAGSNLNFNSLIFTNMSGGNDVTVNVSTPASFSGGDLIWSQSYLPIFNGGNVANPDGDISGSGRFTRWIDLGVGTTYCPGSSQFSVSSKVSAYSTNESSRIDFSFIRDQENWFQVWGGGVKARSGIRSGVPVTASSTLTIDNAGIGGSNNSVVASTTYYNTNGWNDASQYGWPNNWRIVDNIVADEGYNYQYLYSRYFLNHGQG